MRSLVLLSPLLLALPTTSIKLLLPLYLYPGENATAWTPITTTIAAHPNVEFEIVVNPNSGPGAISPPTDDNYNTGVAQLNSFPNVHTVGYVPTGHGSRDMAAVKADVDSYARWASYSASNIAVGGIYFDEVSSEPTDAMYSYYETASAYARSAIPDAQVVFNPGYRAPERYFDYCDLMAEFEDSYANYQAQGILAQVPEGKRGKSAFQIYDTPEGADVEGLMADMEGGGIGAVYFGADCCYKVWSGELLGRMADAAR